MLPILPHTPDDNWPRRIAILGVGLLGGSVALALRRRFPDCRITGTARQQEKCDRLLAAGIVDSASTSIDQACRDADVIVAAGPVNTIAAVVLEAAAAAPTDCLITDVGSTKAQLAADVAGNPRAAKMFVPAHPIAGSEKTGFEHASADLFDDRVVVVTPTERNSAEIIDRTKQFWEATGGNVRLMSPADHDTHLAAISHVPHLVSAVVARLATDQSRPLAGSGWEDITRVAAGDPAMWAAICQQNRPAIAAELKRLAGEVDQLRQTLQAADDRAMEAWLAEAKRIKQQTTHQD